MDIDLSHVKTIIERYSKKKGALIPLLQDIQAIYGYVPDEAVQLVAQELSIFPVEIYGVLTFYTQFYLMPARETHYQSVSGHGLSCNGRQKLV